MPDRDLSEAEKSILVHLLKNGDNVPANLAEDLEYHSKHVNKVLNQGDDSLESRGIVENKGRGVYTLTEAGRLLARQYLED